MLVNSIEITGQRSIAPGKTATLKATVAPKNAKVKTLSWSTSSSYATVNNGKITLSPDAPIGSSFYVYADATDGSGISVSYRLRVLDLASSVSLSASTPSGGSIDWNKNGTPKQLNMRSASNRWSNTVNVSASVWTGNGYSNDTELLWTSSNPKVATVESTSTQGARVTALSSGTATITAKANDGSGKSARFTVKVTTPASGVTVNSSSLSTFSGRFKLLGVGKSVSNKAVVSDAFGKPSSTKVVWSEKVLVFDDLSFLDELDDLGALSYADLQEQINNGNASEWSELERWITLSSSGTVKAHKALREIAADCHVITWVQATTTDGTNLSDGVAYYLVNPHTKLALEYRSGYLYTGEGGTIDIYSYGIDKGIARDFVVSSSNPSVASAYIYDDMLYIYSASETTGSARITVKATDGSNKSASISVRVVK